MSNKLVKDLKINPIFKSVFRSDSYESNEALRLLIQSFLKRDVDQVILIHNEPLVGIINEKQIRMDILAKLKDGTKVNVEMQTYRQNEDLPVRMLYYISRLFVQQKMKGRFYEDIHQSHMILFVGKNIFEDNRVYHHFQFHEDHGERLEKKEAKMQIHVVEMARADTVDMQDCDAISK